MNEHDITIKTYLTADEFIAFRNLCTVNGLSNSAYIRHMIKKEIAAAAYEKLKREGLIEESASLGLK